MSRSLNALLGLRVRVIVLLLLPVLVSGGLALGLTSRSVSQYERTQTEKRLQTQGPAVARLFAKSAKKYFRSADKPVPFSRDVQQVTSAEIYYVANPGAAFAYPGGNVPVWPNLALDWTRVDRGATQTLEAVPPGRDERYTIVASGVFFTQDYLADPTGRQDAIGAIVLARPLGQLAPTESFWAHRLAPAFALGGVAAVLLGLLLAIRLIAPLRRLVAATAAIGRGEYRVPLNRRRRDEFGVLNRAVGDMAAEIGAARERERLFLMSVSHELRTPLTAIQGYVGALADGMVDGEDGRREAYDVIAVEAVRLERLITDLLDLAKLEGGRFTFRREEVDLEALLEGCLAARGTAARQKGIILEAGIGPVGTVTGDGDRIQQVVANLIDNAIRWTPRGGVVRLAAGVDGGAIRIAVADSGPGIAVEKRADVFRPFFSEDAAGTGLGLSIASELAIAMGGSLSVGDAREGGALFVFALRGRTAMARRAPYAIA